MATGRSHLDILVRHGLEWHSCFFILPTKRAHFDLDQHLRLDRGEVVPYFASRYASVLCFYPPGLLLPDWRIMYVSIMSFMFLGPTRRSLIILIWVIWTGLIAFNWFGVECLASPQRWVAYSSPFDVQTFSQTDSGALTEDVIVGSLIGFISAWLIYRIYFRSPFTGTGVSSNLANREPAGESNTSEPVGEPRSVYRESRTRDGFMELSQMPSSREDSTAFSNDERVWRV